MADPRDTDPVDQDSRESELGPRSHGPSISPWLVIGAIALIAAVVYAISAVRV